MTHAESETKKRHAELAAEIQRHDHAYYVEGRQLITDHEYDQLFSELQKLEKEFPGLVMPESPIQRVGGAPSEEFARFQHLVPMLSLDKVAASEQPTSAEEPDRDKRNRAAPLVIAPFKMDTRTECMPSLAIHSLTRRTAPGQYRDMFGEP